MLFLKLIDNQFLSLVLSILKSSLLVPLLLDESRGLSHCVGKSKMFNLDLIVLPFYLSCFILHFLIKYCYIFNYPSLYPNALKPIILSFSNQFVQFQSSYWLACTKSILSTDSTLFFTLKSSHKALLAKNMPTIGSHWKIVIFFTENTAIR